jgi:hypothetical protein
VRENAVKLARKYAIPNTNPIKYRKNIAQAFIGDDIGDRKMFNHGIWNWHFKVSRNYMELLMLILQNAKDIAPDRRKNFSHIIAAKMQNEDDQEDLRKQFFASIFGSSKPAIEEFNQVFRMCTTPSPDPTKTDDCPEGKDPRFRFIVLNNQCTSNKIEDKLSWIEVHGSWLLKPFTVGSKKWGDLVKKHYDKNWKDNVDHKLEKLQDKIIAKKAMEKAIKKGIKIGKQDATESKYALAGKPLDEDEFDE